MGKNASLTVFISRARIYGLVFFILSTVVMSYLVFFSPDYSDVYYARLGRILVIFAVPFFVVALFVSLFDRLCDRGVNFSQRGIEKNTIFKPFFLEWSKVERVKVFKVVGFADLRIVHRADNQPLELAVQLLEFDHVKIQSIKEMAPVPVDIMR